MHAMDRIKKFLIIFCCLFCTLAYGANTLCCHCHRNNLLKNMASKNESSNNDSTESSSKEDSDSKDDHSKDNNSEDNDSEDDDSKDKKASKKEPPKIGNLILPNSQQPGALVSFGQNILNKNQFEILLGTQHFIGGSSLEALTFFPAAIYGLTDTSSLLFTLPYVAINRSGDEQSSGLSDAVVQYEYAFYSESNAYFSDQATVVTNISLPTGSVKKQPRIGYGSPSFFLGWTFFRSYPLWSFFTSQGATITGDQSCFKAGNEYLYQAGMIRHICNINKSWTFAGMLELNGQYTEKDKFQGVSDPNTGGNVVYLTPSLWISSRHLILQIGVGYPVVQDLFGDQPKASYMIASTIAWTFN
jgi:hypothetical protein